jgi:N-acetylneuraminic acid mutarotase
MTVAVGDEVVVIGGESTVTSAAHRNVEAYNVRSDRWRVLKPLNTGRHSGAAVVLGRSIHVVTGSENRGGAPESTSHEILKF